MNTQLRAAGLCACLIAASVMAPGIARAAQDAFAVFGKVEADRWEKVVRNANLKAN
jgi:hypothetical protein